jgi:RNA polymerase sigma-70 factor (ECF subfamily)
VAAPIRSAVNAEQFMSNIGGDRMAVPRVMGGAIQPGVGDEPGTSSLLGLAANATIRRRGIGHCGTGHAEPELVIGWTSERNPRCRTGRTARPTGELMDQDRLADLVRRSSLGHDNAFAELYDLSSARVYGVILRVLRSPDLAAETTQDVFVEIWRTCTRYQPDRGGVLAWMLTIAHRRAVDRVRSTESREAREERYAEREVSRPHDEVAEAAERHLDADRVRSGLWRLSELQREAVTLAYFGGYTQSQIARMLQIPLGTVKTRMRDGLIKLRDALEVQT